MNQIQDVAKIESIKRYFNSWTVVLILCATLGFAPFFPEPHIVGKIRWIAGGAVGMKFIDWFDVIQHGTPFILLIRLIILKILKKK